MPRYSALVVLAALLSGAASCSTAEAPSRETLARASGQTEARLDRVRRVVADIEGRLLAFRRVEGTWRVGDTAGGFAAYLDAGRAARIDERLEEEDGTQSRVRYYFLGQALVHCTRDRDDLSVSVFFDPTGDVIQADKRVDGRADALTAAEVRAIQRHAEQLRLQAESIGAER